MEQQRKPGKSRLVYDKASRSIIAVGEGSPIPSVQRMFTALYQAEVDFHIASAWDAGIRVTVFKPRGGVSSHRGFTVGPAPHDHPDWTAMWEAVVLWICEVVKSDWEALEDQAPVCSGCIECTVGTVPDRFNSGLCVYHIAEHVLRTHGPTKGDAPL